MDSIQAGRKPSLLKRVFSNGSQYLEAAEQDQPLVIADENADSIDWLRIIPFAMMHVVCFAVIWVGVSPIAVIMAVVMYLIRMFAITGLYHRYFSHKSFQTSRVGQFIFGELGA